MENTVFLRPHHALCSQFFTGHGYSDEFVENMTHILNSLNTDNLKVKFVSGCDDICACCPKNKDGKCENESKVNQTDLKCLEEYNFAIGEELYWQYIKARVIEKLKSQQKLPSVCSKCKWLSICESIKFDSL